MSNNKYSLRYLPIFYDDLNEKVHYIAFEKKNPEAANRLIDAIENAIMERLPMAESFEQYQSRISRPYPYFRIYVGNFIVFYVVIDDDSDNKIMEVRRLLYNRQDRDNIL